MKKYIIFATMFLLIMGLASATCTTIHGWGIRNSAGNLNGTQTETNVSIFYVYTGGTTQLTESYANLEYYDGSIDFNLCGIEALNTSQDWYGEVTITGNTISPRFNFTSVKESLITSQITAHSDLTNLAWSVAGHTIDANLDMNSNNVTEIDFIEALDWANVSITESQISNLQSYLLDTTDTFTGLLTINQASANTKAFALTSTDEDANVPIVQFIKGTTSDYYINLLGADSTFSNIFYRNRHADNTSGGVMYIKQDHPSDDQEVLYLQQDGSGYGLEVNSVGGGISTQTSDTNSYGFQSITTGDITATVNAQNRFDCRGTSSTKACLQTDNDGAGKGLYIDQNGANNALYIEHDGTNTDAISILSNNLLSANEGLYYGQLADATQKMTLLGGKNSTLGTYYFYRNQPDTDTAGATMFINQDHASDNQNAVIIDNDGTGDGLFINQDGNGIGLNIDHEGTDTNAIYVTSPTTNEALHILGTGDPSANSAMVRLQNDVQRTTANEYGIFAVTSAPGTESTKRGVWYDVKTSDYVQAMRNLGTGGGLSIENDGAKYGLFINQDGNSQGIYIDSEATTNTKYALVVDVTQGARGQQIVQSGNEQAININKIGTGAGNAVQVANAGTGYGVFIDQNSEATALAIDQEGSKPGLYINSDAGKQLIYLGNNDSNLGISTDNNVFYTNKATAKRVMDIMQDHASATGDVLKIYNDGIGYGLIVDQNGADSSLVTSYSSSTLPSAGSLYASVYFDVEPGALARGVVIDQNSAQQALMVRKLNTSSGNAVDVENDGTGYGLFINQDGDGIGIDIDSESTSNNMFALKVDAVNPNAAAVAITHTGIRTAVTDPVLSIVSSNADASNVGPLLRGDISGNHDGIRIVKAGAGVGDVFEAYNDGTGAGVFIDQNGNGIALNIDSEATTKAAIDIQDIPSNISLSIAVNDAISFNRTDTTTQNIFMNASGCMIMQAGSNKLSVCP